MRPVDSLVCFGGVAIHQHAFLLRFVGIGSLRACSPSNLRGTPRTTTKLCWRGWRRGCKAIGAMLNSFICENTLVGGTSLTKDMGGCPIERRKMRLNSMATQTLKRKSQDILGSCNRELNRWSYKGIQLKSRVKRSWCQWQHDKWLAPANKFNGSSWKVWGFDAGCGGRGSLLSRKLIANGLQRDYAEFQIRCAIKSLTAMKQ